MWKKLWPCDENAIILQGINRPIKTKIPMIALIVSVAAFAWLLSTPYAAGHVALAADEPTYSISGHVTDYRGEASQGVTVQISPDTQKQFLPLIVQPAKAGGSQALGMPSALSVNKPLSSSSTILTDANGNYSQTGLPAGNYTITISTTAAQSSAVQSTTSKRKVTLPPNAEDQDFKLPPPSGEMVYIPYGEFQMGCILEHNGDFACPENELPLHRVILDAYLIDKYEVTNAQYALCWKDGACTGPDFFSSYSRLIYFTLPEYDNYPVVYVNWDQATTYCAWAGKRLPSEAEWEKAARGTSLHAYPWGDEPPDCTRANGADRVTNTYCVGETDAVGNYPDGASQYGVMDMSGNVWEWVNDWYGYNYYRESPEINPTGPTSGTQKTIRGAAYNWSAEFLRTSIRRSYSTQFYALGFRCAASIE
jgi:formylglycine-generating enzyme required for sulfatase activity